MLKIKVREAIETPAMIELVQDENNRTLLAKMTSRTDAKALYDLITSAVEDYHGELHDYFHSDILDKSFVVADNYFVALDSVDMLNDVANFIQKIAL